MSYTFYSISYTFNNLAIKHIRPFTLRVFSRIFYVNEEESTIYPGG